MYVCVWCGGGGGNFSAYGTLMRGRVGVGTGGAGRGWVVEVVVRRQDGVCLERGWNPNYSLLGTHTTRTTYYLEPTPPELLIIWNPHHPNYSLFGTHTTRTTRYLEPTPPKLLIIWNPHHPNYSLFRTQTTLLFSTHTTRTL